MKYILIILTTAAGLLAGIGLDLDYDMSVISLTRGGEAQEVLSLEELNGELYDDKDYSPALEEATQLLRLYNAAALKLSFGPRLSLYSRLRQSYGFYEDDMYMPFALNRFYVGWKGDVLKLKAGRFFAADATVRRSIDGVSADLRLLRSMPTRVVYGAQAPSVYSSDIAPDFFGRQYLLLQQALPFSVTAAYTLITDEEAAETYNHILAASWRGSAAGFRISGYGEFRATEGKLGNSYLNLSRELSDQLLLNIDYRTVLQQDWVLDADDDVYFSGNAYDVLRLGAYYELNSKLGFEVSQLLTLYKNDTYANTFLEVLLPYGGAGIVFLKTPEGSETDLSLKLNHTFFKHLRVEAGYNYITEDLGVDGLDNATATGSFFGADYRLLHSLSTGLRVYQMDSPQFDSYTRALFKLNYRLSL